jgi:hypothetical protein
MSDTTLERLTERARQDAEARYYAESDALERAAALEDEPEVDGNFAKGVMNALLLAAVVLAMVGYVVHRVVS